MKAVAAFVLLIPLLMLLTHVSWSQEVSNCDLILSGKVVDEHDASNLEYATVFVKELSRGVSADFKGRFTLNGLCPGDYTLVISHVSCKPRHEKITVQSDMEKTLYLEHHVLGLETVDVIGEKIEKPNLQAKTELEAEELALSSGKSLGEALKSISGVNTLQTGPTIAKPVIHGLHSNRILVLNNGIRQEGQQWGAEHGPEIDPFVANKLSVIKGAEAVRYGADAIGGIILVEPPQLMNEAGFGGTANLVGMSNGRQGAGALMLQGGMSNGFGWRVQSSYKRSGDAHAADYNLSNTGLRELNFSGALGLTRGNVSGEVFFSRFRSEFAILRSAHIGNLTDLRNAILSDRPIFMEDFTYTIDHPKQEVRHDLLKIKFLLKGKKGDLVKFEHGIQFDDRKEFDRRRGANFNLPSISLGLTTHTSSLIWEHRALGSMKGEVGLSSLWQRNRNRAGTNAQFLIPDYKSLGVGLHLIERFVFDKVELESGVRLDHRVLKPFLFDNNDVLLTPEYEFNNFTASFSILYEASAQLSFRSNLATAWRPPHVSELFSDGLHHGSASMEEGLLINQGAPVNNLDEVSLNSENALKWITTATYANEKFSLEISPYVNRVNNYIYLRPKDIRLTIRGAFPVFQYTQTNADFIGADIQTTVNISDRLEYNGQASFIRARDVSQDDVLIFIPANSFSNEFRMAFESFGSLKSPYFSLEAQTVMRQGRAPEAFLDFENSEIPEQIFDFKEAPQGYTLLNLQMGFDYLLGLHQLSVNLSIQNLMNISYRDYMNRYRYFTDDTGRNISLRFNYQF